MVICEPGSASRSPRTERLATDLVVAGGGLSGVCAAVTAAREGIQVVLVQDRPVLGGNASSEVRLWILGATSHMGNNNRWAREGGVVDEILVENLYRNPEGNPLILDTILLEKVVSEPNITLLLNTAVSEVEKSGTDHISAVAAFCSQNSTRYEITAPLFCDASGDGIMGFLAGAAFRMGAEARDDFDEGLAPDAAYGELLGHSLYFYSKDAGKPVKFVPPSFALADIREIPRYRQIRASDSGCRFWWLEYGGRLDTVHDTEKIKWELWRVAYGVWNHIKNSGEFTDVENLTLEWVGTIPGKRESRRFEGPVMMTQRDVVEQREWPDAVSFGGWAMDLHPADGVYSPMAPCQQWHSKGVYQIPYRTMFSRNLDNLFLTGRLISVSHVAFGSTRVMATCGHNGQAVGMAAALCRRDGLKPAEIAEGELMLRLQRDLLRAGQYIPGVVLRDVEDLAGSALVTASSRYVLATLPPDGSPVALDSRRAMLLPFAAGPVPEMTVWVDAASDTVLNAELRVASRPGNFTPDVTLEQVAVPVEAGTRRAVVLKFNAMLAEAQYGFVCLEANPALSVHRSTQRVTGVLSLSQSMNAAVAKGAVQEPPAESGIDRFEFWIPSRRPGGENLAIRVEPGVDVFGPENVTNGIARPVLEPNAWVADPADPAPALTLTWTEPQTVGRLEITFDTDMDHPMESVLMGHPEREIPFCVKRFRVRDGAGTVLHESGENHQTCVSVRLKVPVKTAALTIEVVERWGAPAAIFAVRCYPA